jgi:hypothetical protein
MEILEYTKGVKTFEKTKLLGLLDTLKVEANTLDENLRNVQANEVKLDELAERWVLTKSMNRQLAQHGYRADDLVEQSRMGITVINTLLPELGKIVNSYKDTLWDGKLLTLKQTNLLNLIEHIGFWLKFTRTMYDVLLTMNNKSVDPTKYLSQHDSKWLNGTQALYKQFTIDLAKGTRALIKQLDEMPDLPVAEGPLATYESMEGKDKIDLLKRGFGVHIVNPLYWFSLGKANLNIARIENMREENMQFGAKIAQAVNLRNQTADPDLDRRIEIYQEQIIRNNHKIEQIEAEYV